MIGEVIKSTDLQSVECVVKLFDKSRWRIVSGVAKKFTIYFEKGEPIEVYFEELPIDQIFANIRILFDKKNQVIAQKSGKKGQLRVCVQGNWKNRVRIDNHLKKRNLNTETSYKIYNHLSNLEII